MTLKAVLYNPVFFKEKENEETHHQKASSD